MLFVIMRILVVCEIKDINVVKIADVQTVDVEVVGSFS